MRALAVLMVVSYHVWFGRVSGGVDVFLFISAFLMTLQFVRRHDRGAPAALGRHYLHVFWRLLPMAALVILTVILAGWAFLPATRWGGLITQAWSSLFYVENWTLKALAVDYYAGNHALASPLQHFWSLSIQGQVFILWPLIFLAASWIARRRGLGYKKLLTWVFGAVFVLSLAFSAWYTATSQGEAYFDTFARLWEFALGSLLALGLKFLNLPRALRVVLGWAGIVAMLSCGFLVDVQGAFPGVIALWPTLSAAAVIIAGDTGSRFGVDRVLSSRPLRSLGGMSYALYLWHWPILVLALTHFDRENADGRLGVAVVLLALVLAYLSSRFVEKPLRSWTWAAARVRHAALACVAAVVVAAAPLGGWQLIYNAKLSAPITASERDNPGALALESGYIDQVGEDAPVLPSPEQIAQDWVSLAGKCDGPFAPDAGQDLNERCAFQGPADGTATKTVMVLGHSHAEQIMAAIKPVAEERNWNLVSALRGGCAFSPVEPTGNDECDSFNQDVRGYVDKVKPDLVITMATESVPDSPDEELGRGFESMVEDLGEMGVNVLGIRDNPRSATNMAECALQRGDDSPDCALVRSQVLAKTPAYAGLDGAHHNVRFMDLSDRICLRESCPPVLGNVRVYLDANHLSGTYATTLSTAFARDFTRLYGG
ncbi:MULTISPECIES: acyltransferase family protein [Arthrobacter]|uniref:Acyltransferase family protein n=1 Tax=Arthrobacter nanjingensis TaxID=1387716 RepID=A0ABU9KQ99_9MICC